MRRLTAALCSFALLACGSEPTSLDGGTSVAQSVEIVEGDGQTVQVAETTDTIRVVVRDNAGDPVPGDLISYEVDGPSECGNWESGSLSADQNGEGRNVIHAGTVADTRTDVDCTFRVVHSAQGAPEPLVDSARVEVLPGAAVDTVEVGTRVVGANPPHTYPADWLADEWGNPIPYRLDADSLVVSGADTLGGEAGRTLSLADGAAQGDSAVVCAWDTSNELVFPALATVHDRGEKLTLGVQGGDPEDGNGTIQPEDCI